MNKQSGVLTRSKEEDLNLPSVIKICHFEMDDDAIARLNTMFKIIFKDRFRIVSSDEAMISLVYINSATKERALLASYQMKYSGLPIIALVDSLSDTVHDSIDNVCYIERPLRREPFWHAVVELLTNKNKIKAVSKEQLDKATQTQTASSAQVLDDKIKKTPARPGVSWLKEKTSDDLVYYNPKKYLLFYLKDLMAQAHPPQTVLNIELLHKYHIVLYPDKKTALIDFSRSRFRNLAIMKFKDFDDHKKCQLTIEKNYSTDMKLSSNLTGFTSLTFDSLLWSFALHTSKGCHLPKSTSINEKMYLYTWPNLTRLDKIPHAMRISSLWINAPYSLHEITAILGVNPEDVYSFYTAVSVLGLVGTAEQEIKNNDAVTASLPVKGETLLENKKRGLFGAILRRLTRH